MSNPEKARLFVPPSIDDYGLNVYQYRILFHFMVLHVQNKKHWGGARRISKLCIMSDRVAKRSISELTDFGLIEWAEMPPEEAKTICQGKQPSITEGFDLFCEWCGSSTIVLQSHHFPIPRSLGGQSAVQICPSCHYEYHHLVEQGFFKLTDYAIAMIEGAA